jgi:hypothetical protein
VYECDGIIQSNTISGNSADWGGGLNLCNGTIQNNTISGNSAGTHGGGIGFCDATIRNNTISSNTAGSYGGGLIECHGTIENNTISGNSAGSAGGGLAACHGPLRSNIITGNSAYGGGGVYDCDGTIENNTISDNSAGSEHGGGLYFCDSTIQNNTIEGNTAEIRGGGVYDCGGIIQNNTVSANSAGWGGGFGFCDATIQNNTISSNTAGSFGAGLIESHGTIQNNVITGNSAGLGGGGLTACHGSLRGNLIACNSAERGAGVHDCDGAIENNTITDNSANLYGGMYYCEGTIRNCIIWGNTGGSDPQIRECVVPTYSCIHGWTGGGVGNTASDPLFVDADGPDNSTPTYQDNDYRLSPLSPCIDEGSNQKWMSGAVDLDGNPRIVDGDEDTVAVVDMGAYEYSPPGDESPPYVDGCVPAPGALDVDIGANIVLHVKDDGDGVDQTSIVVTVNGVQVTPTITGTPADYTVVYDPPSDFDYSQTVTVTVNAADLCSPPNVMAQVVYSFTTMAEDIAPPVITLSGEAIMTLECGTPYAEPGYTATDDRDGDLTADVVVTGSVDHTVLGSYALHYNVSDSTGNPAEEKTRTVNVVDTSAPVITLLGDTAMTLECGTPYVEPGYTATDVCEGDLTPNVVVTGGVDETFVGSYALKYNVEDSSGNPAAEKARVVEVVDTTPPVITLEGDNPMTLEVGTPYEEPGYTATDVCDGDLTENVVLAGTVDANVVGSYILSYNVSDWIGNPAQEQIRTVNVVEAAPFEIVQIMEGGPEGAVQLTWNSRPGATYTIWSCTDLCGEWSEEAVVASEGEATTWADDDTACPCKFYRIEAR